MSKYYVLVKVGEVGREGKGIKSLPGDIDYLVMGEDHHMFAK